MTAEIAILNRSAVTLATDSAITLEVGGAEKIYNTADKLFELSFDAPIGVMIYNSMQFMEIPIDVLIKEYRKSEKCRQRETVFEYAKDFLKYLEKDVPVSNNLVNNHVRKILYKEFLLVREFFTISIMQQMDPVPKGDLNEIIHNKFLGAVQKRIDHYETFNISAAFQNISEDVIISAHEGAFSEAINDCFEEMPIDEDDVELLKKLGILLLVRDEYSDLSTGIVFSGFGSGELFPSLQAFETDGLIAGKLKFRETEKVDISREGETADIVAFAQKEMVDRFLYGIDPEFEESVEYLIYRAVKNSGESLVDDLVKRPKKRIQELKSRVNDMDTSKNLA
jgi:hypothetical protein